MPLARSPLVAFVDTQMDFYIWLEIWYHECVQKGLELSYIMPVCSAYDERQRDATLVHQ